MMTHIVIIVLSYTLTIAIVVLGIAIIVTIWEEVVGIIKDAIRRLRIIRANKKGDKIERKKQIHISDCSTVRDRKN